MTSSEPPWTQPATVDDWPTRLIANPHLHYRLPIPRSYQAPAVTVAGATTAATREDHFFGPQPGQYLGVEYLSPADPAVPLTNWVTTVTALAGFPVLALQQQVGYTPNLLSWEDEGQPLSLQTRLAVDELHLFQGLAQFLQDSPSALARFYILLARRQTVAWKVTLSFPSACFPGLPPELITDNDHVRAGATFAYLQFP